MATMPPPGVHEEGSERSADPDKQGLNQACDMTQPALPEPIFAKGAVKMFTCKTTTMKDLSDFWK